jgi:hypothetical protein
MPPRSSPRGRLGFLGEAKLPFNFINLLLFTFAPPTGVLGFVIYNKNLEILAKDRSNVAAGCSKRW